MLDTSGKWWKGTSFEDLKQYLIALTSSGYPTEEVLQSVCSCGSKIFHIHCHRTAGFSLRTCTKCGGKVYLADSKDAKADAKPKKLKCVECKNDEFIVGLGFSFRKDTSFLSFLKKKEIKWITQGEMCAHCGVLSSYVDWKIDYSPSHHLLKNI